MHACTLVPNSASALHLRVAAEAPYFTKLVYPLQNIGRFGPRDFYRHPFELDIPRFDESIAQGDAPSVTRIHELDRRRSKGKLPYGP